MEILNLQRKFFSEGKTKDVEFRLESLKKLQSTIFELQDEITEALRLDFKKPPFESYATEIGMTLNEIKATIKSLKKWTKPTRVASPLANFPSKSYIHYEPYGMVLMMSPWNYPFQLAIVPLIGAVAAGNCVILKPSAYAPATSKIVAKVIGKSFKREHVAVVEGGREENKALLGEKFDYIFFTGSPTVGKTVMQAAAKNLTPVTLELGGKSPCIIDKDVDLKLATKRLLWGKFLNAGQTCVAPDYLYIHKSKKKEFITYAEQYIEEFFGKNPIDSKDLASIINIKHFNRINSLIDKNKVVIGGKTKAESLRIEPTIMDNVNRQDSIMKEEIFAPILPVLEYEDIEAIISEINREAKPLALYLFTNDKAVEKKILKNVSFGGGCVNDTIVHLANGNMPFGGIGESGIGGYHGKESFLTFSHRKSIVKKSNLLDIKLRYAPYKGKLDILKKIF